MAKRKLKNDKFRKKRGRRSKLLNLYCEHCGKKLMEYQKDGPGILKRLYFDRITTLIKSVAKLECPKCKTLLGVRIVYKKENRLAYRLFAGAILKKF